MSERGLIQIRTMKPEDCRAVAELEAAVFSEPWSEAGLLDSLSRPGYVFLVAEAEGNLAGYCGMQVILDEADVTNVAVAPSFRRRGIGRKLMEALLREARKNGAVQVNLEVRAGNTPAIALYRAFDFTEVGRRKGFYSHPREDALLFSCNFH